jgi:hypothetical protein
VKDVSDADKFRPCGGQALQSILLSVGHQLLGLVSKDSVMDVQALGHSTFGSIGYNLFVFFFREADINVVSLVLPLF